MRELGVRGRLLFSFLGISMFSLVAAASGLYSLSQVGGALDRITEQRVPKRCPGWNSLGVWNASCARRRPCSW